MLIRAGKVYPFLLAMMVCLGYSEMVYSILTNRIAVDEYGLEVYYCPITFFLSDIVYIDWFDVLLLYVLAVALEFCWRNMLAVHYLLLNLAVRTLVEHFYIESGIVVGLASFMALCVLYCVCGGITIFFNSTK